MVHQRIAQVVLGLAAVLALAMLAAHPRVRAIERRLGVSLLLSSGLPFLAIGAVLALDRVGVLTPGVLLDLRPAFAFGLGWIGFTVGMRFELRRLDALPRSLGPFIAVQSAAPMAAVAAVVAAVLVLLGVEPFTRGFLGDVLVFAACAASSAPASVEALAPVVGEPAARLVRAVTDVDDVASLVILGLVAVLVRPEGAGAWVLPPSAWLLLTLALGSMLGVVVFVLLRGAHGPSEELAFLLGGVGLAAGIAGYLSLSVPVVCALAGAVLANLPLADRERLERLLVDVEHPLYLVFLVVVGATWRPHQWQGWVLAAGFAAARVWGKSVGARLGRRLGPADLPEGRALTLALAPQGPIAVVVIVAAGMRRGELPPAVVRWAVNAVILGGVMTEVVVRLLQWRDRRRGAAATAPPSTESSEGAVIDKNAETAKLVVNDKTPNQEAEG